MSTQTDQTVQQKPASMTPAVKRGVIRWAVRDTFGLLIYLPLLFWPAGTWNWPGAWALIAITAAWIIATAVVTIPLHPELLAERMGPRKGAKKWDTAVVGIIGILMVVKLLLAGFDIRYGWLERLPFGVKLAGLIAAVVGFALIVWATRSNAFFSQVVRIQTERGHRVASGGPYRYVRHPAYIGMILNEIGTSLLLGSWLALLPGVISALLILLRTALEDRTLLAELEGYPAFAASTRYRLLPGIW